MEIEINDKISETLKFIMTCKCRAMVSDTRCAKNCECDGSCSIFKETIKQYIDLFNNK